jgi:hypothetical protein
MCDSEAAAETASAARSSKDRREPARDSRGAIPQEKSAVPGPMRIRIPQRRTTHPKAKHKLTYAQIQEPNKTRLRALARFSPVHPRSPAHASSGALLRLLRPLHGRRIAHPALDSVADFIRVRPATAHQQPVRARRHQRQPEAGHARVDIRRQSQATPTTRAAVLCRGTWLDEFLCRRCHRVQPAGRGPRGRFRSRFRSRC